MEANSSENGNGRGYDQRAAHVAQKEEQDDDHQNQPFGQIVQHGMGRVVDQVAAVQVGYDFTPCGSMRSFNSAIFSCSARRSCRLRALAQQHDPLHHIVVVDHPAVHPVDGFADLAQADFRPLLDRRRYRARAPACRSAP